MGYVLLNMVRKNYYVKEIPLYILLFTESYKERIASDMVITTTYEYMGSVLLNIVSFYYCVKEIYPHTHANNQHDGGEGH